MSQPPFNESDPYLKASDAEGLLARASAQGPMFTDEDNADDRNDLSNSEPAEAHDSPAAVDEERAAEGTDTDRTNSMHSIYGPPPGE